MYDMSHYVGTSEAARMANVSSRYIVMLCEAGKLDFVRTPIGRLVSRESIQRFKANRSGTETEHVNSAI